VTGTPGITPAQQPPAPPLRWAVLLRSARTREPLNHSPAPGHASNAFKEPQRWRGGWRAGIGIEKSKAICDPMGPEPMPSGAPNWRSPSRSQSGPLRLLTFFYICMVPSPFPKTRTA